MTCYHPIIAYEVVGKYGPNGKKRIVFDNSDMRDRYKQVQLPCGQCIGCRLAHSKMWAIRCVHESKMHECNSYLTLTYNDDSIPWSSVTGEQTLVKKHLQDFMKRLRKHLEKFDIQVRFFACGEYGETTHRPHYHVILFGYDFPDKVFHTISKDGNPYYVSPTLEKIWSHGQCLVANVTYETCAYVARYVTKKITGEAAKDVYEGIQPEFVNMSRRPGIAKEWFDKYYKDVYPYDEVVIDGRKLRPPRYYDSKYEEINAPQLEAIKEKRVAKAERASVVDETYKRGRLDRKREYQEQKMKDYKRSGI
jgi:hypothetical protein